MVAVTHSLARPTTREEWAHYHAIRREVLWENRGRFNVYDESHPDEYKDGNFPLLLVYEAEPIGVVRIDIERDRAIFRRVAIRNEYQRQGHGTALMQLAERFAKGRGCTILYSYVDPAAVRFYEKCGFERDGNCLASANNVSMQKLL